MPLLFVTLLLRAALLLALLGPSIEPLLLSCKADNLSATELRGLGLACVGVSLAALSGLCVISDGCTACAAAAAMGAGTTACVVGVVVFELLATDGDAGAGDANGEAGVVRLLTGPAPQPELLLTRRLGTPTTPVPPAPLLPLFVATIPPPPLVPFSLPPLTGFSTPLNDVRVARSSPGMPTSDSLCVGVPAFAALHTLPLLLTTDERAGGSLLLVPVFMRDSCWLCCDCWYARSSDSRCARRPAWRVAWRRRGVLLVKDA